MMRSEIQQERKEGVTPTLRQAVISRLQSNRPLLLSAEPSMGLGDNLYRQSAARIALELVCKEAHIPVSHIRIRTVSDSETIPTGDFLLDRQALLVSRTHTAKESSYPIIFLEAYVNALGIHLPKNIHKRAPKLFTHDTGPLQTFDRRQVITRGKELREAAVGKERIVILQAGKQAVKRFSDKQVVQIASHIQKLQPHADIIVITDKKIGAKEPFPHTAGLTVIDTDNINEIAAQNYAADCIIATDTFLTWLAAGARAMRPDRHGYLQPTDMIALYTIADPAVYAIPGISLCISPLIEHIRKRYGIVSGIYNARDYEVGTYATQYGVSITDANQQLAHSLFNDAPIHQIDITHIKNILTTRFAP